MQKVVNMPVLKKFVILDYTNNKVTFDYVILDEDASLEQYIEEILPSNNCCWMEINKDTLITSSLDSLKEFANDN